MSTVAQQVDNKRLLRTRAPSRAAGAKSPPCFSVLARKPKSTNEPPMKNAKIAKIATPRLGSLAKACTEVKTPERTRNVPIKESEKARIARKTVQIFKASRFSITRAECSSAVAASQGISEAFST